ncbi:hypothetical protein AB5J49_08140 [Streptomyces sp. R28]|uniref:Uncharacterized protein n=1 Tax=Streptomyces sp. R28 TaxID=3238628 RepID=A0AB39PSL2_9ACTN
MTTTWRARCSRGHYLASKDVHTTLGPEDWDDTCRCKISPQQREASTETFGHEPVQDDREFFGEVSDDPPVCARCTRTIRAWLPVVIDQEPSGRVITRDQWIGYEVAVLWPCTSAIVLGIDAAA